MTPKGARTQSLSFTFLHVCALSGGGNLLLCRPLRAGLLALVALLHYLLQTLD